jgi:MFS family permease
MPTADVKPTAARKWTVVILLSLGMLLAYIDRTNLSVALAVGDFKRLFHLTDVDRGVLNSAFFWSYALLQIPAGWVVDRYGSKFPYAIGFLFWSLISAATGLIQNVGQLFSMRLMVGVGESVTTSASLRWIRFNCEEKERGLATGILFAGTKFGAAAGIPLAAFLISRWNWRAMFVILGLGGLVWLVFWLALVKKDLVKKDRTEKPASVPTTQASPEDFLFWMKTPVMWGIILGTFAYNYFIYYCLTWLPAYFVESKHLSLNSMSLYTMFSFGGMAVVGIGAGWLADRMIAAGKNAINVRKAFTLLGFLLASTEIIGAISPSQSWSLFFALFSLSGLGLATANYWALTQTLVPKSIIGRLVGVQNFASNCSGIVAPLVTGWLKEVTGHYRAPMAAVLVILLIGLVAYGVMVKPLPRYVTAKSDVVL